MKNHLSIRKASKNDAPLLCQWWNDGKGMTYSDFCDGIHITEEKVMKQLKNENHLIMEFNHQPIGEMVYCDLKDGIVDIGVKICVEEYQNQGYGQLFLSLLISRLFQKGYQCIVLHTMKENTSSCHVYEKLGFSQYQMIEKGYQDDQGLFHDVVYYKLEKNDFHNLYQQQKQIQYKLYSLSQSKFRNSFTLKKNDIDYIEKKGIYKIRQHAYDFIYQRLSLASIENDGKQTPMRGHPVFIAQHATGTCCRGCLEKWHHIPQNRELTQKEIDYIVEVIMQWIERQVKLYEKRKK